jgi:tetratricopeptide (TPR) repeat protein
MGVGRSADAARIYRNTIRANPRLSDVAYLNLAWIVTQEESIGYLDRAVSLFPSSWRAIEQRALHLAKHDPQRAFSSLSDYEGSADGPRERLLRLRLEPSFDSAAYEGTVWQLVNSPDAPEEAQRYAAWYFAGRMQFDAVTELLDGLETDSGWVWTYRGLVAVHLGDWAQAMHSFARAAETAPSWHTMLNLALSTFAHGETREAMRALAAAQEYAKRTGLPRESAEVFVTAARIAPDRTEALKAVAAALEVDPTNTSALLLSRQLESGLAY